MFSFNLGQRLALRRSSEKLFPQTLGLCVSYVDLQRFAQKRFFLPLFAVVGGKHCCWESRSRAHHGGCCADFQEVRWSRADFRPLLVAKSCHFSSASIFSHGATILPDNPLPLDEPPGGSSDIYENISSASFLPPRNGSCRPAIRTAALRCPDSARLHRRSRLCDRWGNIRRASRSFMFCCVRDMSAAGDAKVHHFVDDAFLSDHDVFPA